MDCSVAPGQVVYLHRMIGEGWRMYRQAFGTVYCLVAERRAANSRIVRPVMSV